MSVVTSLCCDDDRLLAKTRLNRGANAGTVSLSVGA